MQVILLLFLVLKILRLVVLPPGKLNMSLWLSLLKMYWNQLPVTSYTMGKTDSAELYRLSVLACYSVSVCSNRTLNIDFLF